MNNTADLESASEWSRLAASRDDGMYARVRRRAHASALTGTAALTQRIIAAARGGLQHRAALHTIC